MPRSSGSSSFSSFSNSSQSSNQFMPARIRTAKPHLKKPRRRQSDSEQFSDFVEEGPQQIPSANSHESIQQKRIRQLTLQVQKLRVENEHLKLNNLKLMKQKESFSLQESKLGNTSQPLSNRRQQIAGLLVESSNVKKHLREVRVESEKNHAEISSLKQKLAQYEQLQKEGGWKNLFISLFIGMLQKISPEIDPGWPEKKKIEVGWKIVKNLVQKALNSGLKPPRVERRTNKSVNI